MNGGMNGRIWFNTYRLITAGPPLDEPDDARYRVFEERNDTHIVASELKDPICHSDECQIGSFSSEATIYIR